MEKKRKTITLGRNKAQSINKLTRSALFLALGFVLPMLSGQLPVIGQALLPMHIPVFLCGMICDWRYGCAVGLILPILRSLVFSVPVFYPTALAVALEMATYGAVIGLVRGAFRKKGLVSIYTALLAAMVAGRIVRALAEMALLGLGGNSFALSTFFSAVIVKGIPGVILHLIAVPAVMLVLERIVRADGKSG